MGNGCEGDLELVVEERVKWRLEVAARCTFYMVPHG